jgi:hypothetical protein
MGTYKLVSFHGQDLPVEFSNGATLEGGSIRLFQRRLRPGYAAPVSDVVVFQMRFDCPEMRQRFYFFHRDGYVWVEEEPSEGPRTSLLFEARAGMDSEGGRNAGFDEFPLRWSHPEEAQGTLFGNELRVGDGEKYLVFMRR